MSDVSGQDRLKVASRHCRGQSLAYLDEHDMALEIFIGGSGRLVCLEAALHLTQLHDSNRVSSHKPAAQRQQRKADAPQRNFQASSRCAPRMPRSGSARLSSAYETSEILPVGLCKQIWVCHHART